MTDIPQREPETFTAGDTVRWLKTVAGYRPEGGWGLEYAFVQAGSHKTATATDNGDGRYLVAIAAADSDWAAGIWYWQAYVHRDGERYRVGEGRLEVKPNFLGATAGFDARSHVKQVLDALEAMLIGKATKDQASYTINGRSLQRLSPEELIKWHSHYKRLYQQELAREQAGQGLGNGGQIRVRFIR